MHQLALALGEGAELALVARQRRRLHRQHVGDGHGRVGLERAGEVHGAHLVGRAGVGEVERAGRRRGDGVEDGEPADAVVAVVDPAVAEVQGGGVGAHHDLGAHPAHDGDEALAQGEVVLGLAVGQAEQLAPGQAQHLGGLLHLDGAHRGQGVGVGGGSTAPFSPRFTMTRCTSAPPRAHRARVPPQDTSGSSGWA